MDDLRDTAYAYYDLLDDDTKQAIKTFSEQMETKALPDLIRFREFSVYMKKIGFSQFGSKKFFDQLRRGDHLVFADIVTLLYIIQSGRPFCEGYSCQNKFITGMYFTCVKCFFQHHCDYFFNVCPKCFYSEHYKHCHKEFLDPIVMLRLKTKQEYQSTGINHTWSDHHEKEEPSGSQTRSKRSKSNSSNKDQSSATSSNNAIVVYKSHPKTRNADRALQLMQFAVGLGNLLVATTTLCTIM